MPVQIFQLKKKLKDPVVLSLEASEKTKNGSKCSKCGHVFQTIAAFSTHSRYCDGTVRSERHRIMNKMKHLQKRFTKKSFVRMARLSDEEIVQWTTSRRDGQIQDDAATKTSEVVSASLSNVSRRSLAKQKSTPVKNSPSDDSDSEISFKISPPPSIVMTGEESSKTAERTRRLSLVLTPILLPNQSNVPAPLSMNECPKKPLRQLTLTEMSSRDGKPTANTPKPMNGHEQHSPTLTMSDDDGVDIIVDVEKKKKSGGSSSLPSSSSKPPVLTRSRNVARRSSGSLTRKRVSGEVRESPTTSNLPKRKR